MTARLPQGPRRTHFLTDIIDADLLAGKNGAKVATRFPPEPNGYLHIGHTKSICLNFGLARDYGGTCNLRMDDTNPVTEDIDYVQSIQHDVAWMGFTWSGEVRFASDYFDYMYDCAVQLIADGKAYIDEQTVEQIRAGRGSFSEPGQNSPYRDRPIAESLALFAAMRAGKYADGTLVLRGKIDMAHPNVLLRDPLLYRIRHAHHHRTGDKWCIYPMYDYAHPIEDAVEGITHSICTLEFESNRDLYDWVLDNTLDPRTKQPWSPRPRQYEFARLGLGYTVMSKRKLLQLVQERRVWGWDDPRMPTVAGMRRRGVTADALRDLADLVGVAKNNSLVDIGKMEFCIRQDLEKRCPRALAVLEPLPVEITNVPDDFADTFALPWWPAASTNPPPEGFLADRPLTFGKQIVIERSDFHAEPPADWKRLAPGREVRLYGAYFLTCDEVLRDADGRVTGLRGRIDAATRGGEAPDGRQPAGTIHWLPATAPKADIRLFDRLLTVEQPDGDSDFLTHLNPDSLQVASGAMVEPTLLQATPGSRFQFVRQGYFVADIVDSKPGQPVWNRTITLRDATVKNKADSRPQRKVEAPQVQAQSAEQTAQQWLADNPDWQTRFADYQALPLPTLTGLAQDGWFDFFVAASKVSGDAEATARWLRNDYKGLLAGRGLEDAGLPAEGFGQFVAFVQSGAVTTAGGRELLAAMLPRAAQAGLTPADLAKSLGLLKTGDAAAIAAGVQAALDSLPAETTRYRAGEQKLWGVLLGAAMKQLRGTADAKAVQDALRQALS
jgi:glutaminyl-tRNA synthetase